MEQLTFWEDRDVWEEWHNLLEPHVKRNGVGGCELCPLDGLCRDLSHGDGTRRDINRNDDKLEKIMEYILDNYDFDDYYRKWKLNTLHKMIKRHRRHDWKWHNGYKGYEPKVDGKFNFLSIMWHKHWIECLEIFERNKDWTWDFETDWCDYKKWKKEFIMEYKGHSFEVLTEKSCDDIFALELDSDKELKEFDKLFDNINKILKDNGFSYNGGYPAIFDFETDSKNVLDQIENMKDEVDFLDEFVECEFNLSIENPLDDLDEYVMGKNGCDLVKWDTGCLGFVGYDNYGVSRGVEIIPFDVKNYERNKSNKPIKHR